MRFPGQRKSKHYFPVTQATPTFDSAHLGPSETHICGIDELVVDIEAHVDDSLLERFALGKGLSQWLPQERADELYAYLQTQQLIRYEYAGGTGGNTLHNYAMLADDHAVLLGVMSETITLNSYAYRYLCDTSSRVDLSHLQPVPGAIGRCITLITPDNERTFVISPGCMSDLRPESVPEDIVATSSALLISAYLICSNPDAPIAAATYRAVEIANRHQVPVVFTLGTGLLVTKYRDMLRAFIRDHVQVLAMNEQEAEALTGESDPIIATQAALELADLVLTTAGAEGLYLGGYCDKDSLRPTRQTLVRHPQLDAYNRYEYSRPMRRQQCQQPVAIFTHLAPYMGGPRKIVNTNGAGDAALAAILHDLAAQHYHAGRCPDSPKHNRPYLAYSSLSQLGRYANRVSYEVLSQHRTRLTRGLPEREDSLEKAYWAS